MDTIIVPVDGATNIKLDVFDYETLTGIQSDVTDTPVAVVDGLDYNCTEEECAWFDNAIRMLQKELRSARIIAPVARGASGGLIGRDNTLTEVPGRGLTLAYTQAYPETVESAFRGLAGDERDFFFETGSVRDFPGSLTLIKRFVFEELERPEVLGRAEWFGTYGILLSGHFLGPDYLKAALIAGNEHSYWMCHSGARNVNMSPGTFSTLAGNIASFGRLVPATPYCAYEPIGRMPGVQAEYLGINEPPLVIPGGHDTCLSHIPIMSTYYQAFRERAGKPVIHLDAGSWTMVARIGGRTELPDDSYRRDIIVQGTVDGQPVVTARYGGGNDFRYIRDRFRARGTEFGCCYDERLLEEVLQSADCFILPNISPINHLSGPFPDIEGRIINEDTLFSDPHRAFAVTNLTTSITTSVQIDAVAGGKDTPIVLTAGGSRDPFFGRLIATLTGRTVYALFDSEGKAVSETTSLGAAIVGKAACQNVHPYTVDVGGIGLVYRELKPLSVGIASLLERYRERFMEEMLIAERNNP